MLYLEVHGEIYLEHHEFCQMASPNKSLISLDFILLPLLS